MPIGFELVKYIVKYIGMYIDKYTKNNRYPSELLRGVFFSLSSTNRNLSIGEKYDA